MNDADNSKPDNLAGPKDVARASSEEPVVASAGAIQSSRWSGTIGPSGIQPTFRSPIATRRDATRRDAMRWASVYEALERVGLLRRSSPEMTCDAPPTCYVASFATLNRIAKILAGP